ncbi:MAG: hypothetical protein HY531_02815 [Chloroflexi bacterium]|nr:hypothetical protein [Chloroflexota bacterium]
MKRFVVADAPAARKHSLRLWDNAGITAVPCWGGGKALPGTDHRALADHPPSREQIARTDYSGGMALLPGTRHPAGGYVTLLDIDKGPQRIGTGDPDCLYAELGTAPGKFHLALRTRDRLDGQVNLLTATSDIAAEIKGYGITALRCWPTLHEGKSRGYKVLHIAPPITWPPLHTSEEVIDHLLAFLVRTTGLKLHTAGLRHEPISHTWKGVAPDWLGLVYDPVVAELERRDCRPRPSGGGMVARCPLHNDHDPSFSVHPLRGFKCHSARCGAQGRLTRPAYLLEISVTPEIRHVSV